MSASIAGRLRELEERQAAEARANAPQLPLILRDRGDGVPRDLTGNAADMGAYAAACIVPVVIKRRIDTGIVPVYGNASLTTMRHGPSTVEVTTAWAAR